MLIKRRRGWEIPESMATPESLVFNRRGMMKAAGAAAAVGVLSACEDSPAGLQMNGASAAASAEDPTAGLYPFTRNERYTIERALTPQFCSVRSRRSRPNISRSWLNASVMPSV